MEKKSASAPKAKAVTAALNVDDRSDAYYTSRFAILQQWLDGTRPYLVERRFELSVGARSLIPVDFEIVRASTDEDSVTIEASNQHTTILIETSSSQTRIRACSTTNEDATKIVESILEQAKQINDDGKIDIRTWNAKHGGDYEDRRLAAPTWAEIKGNYPNAVRPQLERLIEMTEPPSDAGRLILWHGRPGTGKTTAIRTLAKTWHSWCAMQYITDPERLFSDSEYLSEVMRSSAREPIGPTLDTSSKPDSTWKLIVAEDTDEYLRSTAKQDSGAALGRVLNLTDGILGQNHNVMLLLTTNEEITRLHPAVSRPGRSLATIEFETFPLKEGAAFLGAGKKKPSKAMTLAELLVKRGDISEESVTEEADLSIGAYL